jgi:hypothetical protein
MPNVVQYYIIFAAIIANRYLRLLQLFTIVVFYSLSKITKIPEDNAVA